MGSRGSSGRTPPVPSPLPGADRKSTRLNSSHSQISYAVFCLKKKKKNTHNDTTIHYFLTPPYTSAFRRARVPPHIESAHHTSYEIAVAQDYVSLHFAGPRVDD